MSFGGGRDSYTLEYIIKVTNQGGAGGFSQINAGLNQVNTGVKNVTMSQEKMQMIQDKVAASNNKVIQGTQGVTKAMKGLAFGVLGITTAGAEFVGMLSMWRQTTTAVAEAQKEVDTALKESGKNSKDYKDAVNELAKANRWARMTFRNLMLSMFDMVPFFILTINGIVKLRTAYKTLREAQLEQKAMQEVLRRSNIGLAESNLLANTSYAKLTGAQRIAKAEQALMIRSNELLAASNAQVAASNLSVNGSLITSIPLLGKTEKSMGLLGRTGAKLSGMFAGVGAAVSGFLGKILKIAAPIAAIIIAVEAWKNNWGGFGDIVNQVGVKIGNIHPILKTTMELFAKIGNSIDRLVHGDFAGVKDVWVGGSKEMADATTEMSEKQQKALEELNQGLLETANAGSELVTEFVEMDKKARKTFLFEHGIKGGAKSRFTEAAEELDKIKQQVIDFADDMELIRLDESLGKMFDLPASFYKKIEWTFSKRFKDSADKGIQNLGNELEKAAKEGKGFEGFKQAIINAVKFDPSLMDKLKVLDPKVYAEFKKIMDEAAGKLKSIATTSMNAWTSGTILDPNSGEGITTFDKNGKAINTPKGGGGGILKPVIDAIKKGVAEFPAAIGSIDWTAAGTALREGILKVITLENMKNMGTWIRMNMIDPLILGIQGALGPWIEQFRNDPIGTTIGTLNTATEFISNFVAGLLGYPGGEKEMFADWERQLREMFAGNETINGLRLLISNPIQGLMELIKGVGPADEGFAGGGFDFHENEDIISQLKTYVIDPIVSAVDEAFNILDTLVNGNPWLYKILQGDVIGGISELISMAAAAIGKGQSGTADDNLLTAEEAWKSIDTNLVQPVISAVDKAYNALNTYISDPVKKAIAAAYSGLTGWDAAMAAVVGNTAEGASDGTSRFTNAQSAVHSLPKSFSNEGPAGFGGMDVGGGNDKKTGPDSVESAQKSADAIKQVFLKLSGELSNIWLGMASNFSGIMNSFGANAASGSKQVQSEFSNLWSFSTQIFNDLATIWSADMNSLGANAASGSEQVQSEFSSMWEFSTQVFNDMADVWSEDVNLMIRLAADASGDIQSEFGDMVSKLWKSFVKLANNFEKAMKNMVHNAQAAANGINKALNSIEDEEVVIRYRVEGGPLAKGGLMSFAGGGVMSAAGGKLLTTYGPQMYMIGDNPGGRESVWAIPHNNPGPTVAKIDRMYKPSGGGSGGVTVLNGNFNFVIPAEGIINNVKLNKRIKMTVGENRDRFGF